MCWSNVRRSMLTCHPLYYVILFTTVNLFTTINLFTTEQRAAIYADWRKEAPQLYGQVTEGGW